MKVTHEKTENRQAFLRLEMEPAEITATTEVTFRRLVKQVNVPGFRRGKAPRHIFERSFGSDRLFHEMLDDLVPDAYKKAVEEQKLEPFARPTIEVVQEKPEVVITVVVPLKPEVTLGDYHGISMKPPEVNVTEEMVDKVIDRLRHDKATWEPVDRASGIGDMVVMDMESTLKGQPWIQPKGLQYQLTEETAGPVPGFVGQLVGLKKSEAKEFALRFPDDYARKEMAGADATFKVMVNEVKREVLPEVTDEFAVLVDKESATVQGLRDKIMSQMKERAEHEAEHEFEDRVIEAATAASHVEYPPALLDAEVDTMLERFFRNLQQTGQDIGRYLQTIGKTVDQMREDLKPSAQKRVAESLVLGKIAEAEQIAPTPEEISAEIEEMVKNTDPAQQETTRQALNAEDNRESIASSLVSRKTMKRLTEIAIAAADATPAPAAEEMPKDLEKK